MFSGSNVLAFLGQQHLAPEADVAQLVALGVEFRV
jgi:hypothetical protein